MLTKQGAMRRRGGVGSNTRSGFGPELPYRDSFFTVRPFPSLVLAIECFRRFYNPSLETSREICESLEKACSVVSVRRVAHNS